MAKKDWSTYSTEDLIKRKKTLSTAGYMLVGILMLLFIVNTYNAYVTSEMTAMSAVPIAFIPIVIVNFRNVDLITKEIERREHAG